jgi:hypothetical protein
LTKILKLSLAIVLLLSCLETGDVGLGMDSSESYEVYTPQGLITWWHCEDDTLDGVGRNDCDDNVLFDEGYLGRGWRFDSTHYLNSPGHGINEAETITIEGWVKPDMLPPSTFIRFITYVGETYVKAVVRYDGTAGPGTLHFYIGYNETLHHIWARGVLRVGEFQHFAATYDGTTMRLYLNGEKVGENEVEGELQKGRHMIIGSMTEPFYGVLDEIRIYDRALNETEIKRIHKSYQAVLPHTLYNFRRLTDHSENYRHVTTGEGCVAWMAKDGNYDIYMFDGASVTRVTENEELAFNLALNGGRLFWQAWGDWNGSEIFIYDIGEGETTRLTNNTYRERDASIHGDLVAYSMAVEGYNSEIYLQRISDGTVRKLTDNGYPDNGPRIWGDVVAWTGDYGDLESSGGREGYGEVYYCNVSSGVVFRLTNDDVTDTVLDVEDGVILFVRRDAVDTLYLYDARTDDLYNISDIDSTPIEFPVISDGYVAWSGCDPSYPYADSEIYVYDMGAHERRAVTVNSAGDRHPSYSSGGIVWQGNNDGDYEIYRYDIESGRTVQLTFNNESDHDPIAEGGMVVWRAWDGQHEDIMAAVPYVKAGYTAFTEPEIVGTVDQPSPEETSEIDEGSETDSVRPGIETMAIAALILISVGVLLLRRISRK